MLIRGNRVLHSTLMVLVFLVSIIIYLSCYLSNRMARFHGSIVSVVSFSSNNSGEKYRTVAGKISLKWNKKSDRSDRKGLKKERIFAKSKSDSLYRLGDFSCNHNGDPKLQMNQTENNTQIITAAIYESGHREFSSLICPDLGRNIKLIILVTSAPKRQDARMAIRYTWGHFGMRSDVAFAFMIGRTVSQETEMMLTQENGIYMDLIRGHFIDTYNNLTLKTISMLEWVDRACPNASFILKTDDDMFINVQKLLEFIEKHFHVKRTIYGHIVKRWKPIRRVLSKYHTSVAQYSAEYFPTFATGPAYLITTDVVHDLYTTSLKQTFLQLEDVFITGIVAQLLKIERKNIQSFLNMWIAYKPCNIQRMISIHDVRSEEQYELWRLLFIKSRKCSYH